jgi:hypothetical protein
MGSVRRRQFTIVKKMTSNGLGSTKTRYNRNYKLLILLLARNVILQLQQYSVSEPNYNCKLLLTRPFQIRVGIVACCLNRD